MLGRSPIGLRSSGNDRAARLPLTTVDARGLRCPMPLVMAKVAAEQLAAGEGLVVLATDPEASLDLAAWAAAQGYELTEHDREGFTEFVLLREQ